MISDMIKYKDGNFDALCKLNIEQDKAFKNLKKAVKECKKAKITFGLVLDDLQCYDGNLVREYMDAGEERYKGGECCVGLLGEASTTNKLKIASSLSDDHHILSLTKRGADLFLDKKL
jgi:hypothetical protein